MTEQFRYMSFMCEHPFCTSEGKSWTIHRASIQIYRKPSCCVISIASLKNWPNLSNGKPVWCASTEHPFLSQRHFNYSSIFRREEVHFTHSLSNDGRSRNRSNRAKICSNRASMCALSHLISSFLLSHSSLCIRLSSLLFSNL
jgi:hypothetical protein